jgi:dTDP-4-dehydrorhamnose 3,5-epimerase
MNIIEGEIPGLLTLEPKIFQDERGYFFESFNVKRFHELTGLDYTFCQDNESLSQKNVLRGLHFQSPPFAQGKLVRVVSGSVLDIAVDIRKSSPFYGKYQTIELSASNKRMFFIPPGFAHGFLALEDNTVFSYKCTNYYETSAEKTLKWNDRDLDIKWPINKPLVSEKDQTGEDFINFITPFK